MVEGAEKRGRMSKAKLEENSDPPAFTVPASTTPPQFIHNTVCCSHLMHCCCVAMHCLYRTGSSAYCCAELPVPVAAESSHAYYYRPCHGGGNDVLVGLAAGHAQECNRPVQFLSADVSLLWTLLQHETSLLLEVLFLFESWLL